MTTPTRLSIRSVLPLLLLPLVASTARAQQPQDLDLQEELDVSRVILDVRALDNRGRAIPDLEPADFDIVVDGHAVKVESVDWITGTLPDIEGIERLSPGDENWAPGRGRLIVLLFQRSLLGSRMPGLMKMRDVLAGFVDELPPEDRVAILVHDTHLKIYTDFTDDRQRLSGILADAIVEQRPPGEVSAGPEPSLLSRVAAEDARDAAELEDALLLLGRSMRRLPGAKTLIFVGYSMNRWEGSSQVLGEALGLLIAGRVTMFSMDITRADYHSLEGPMIQAAEESGGFYVKTNVFSQGAMSKVEQAMDGVYEVSFIKPRLPGGRHEIRMALRSRKGQVYHRRFYDD